jgi:predicted AlkP superfamily pyrophosphatase or phosphodiesterase
MKTRSKVLIVGIDGLILDSAIKSERAPHLTYLQNNSYFVETEVDMPTVSGPSWSTLLTGKRQDVHKVTSNKFLAHNLAEAPDVLTRARTSNPSLTTYAAAGWPPLIDPNDVGPVIADQGHIRFFNDGETLGYLQVDKEVLDHSLKTLKEIGPDISFVYFCGVDEAGHKFGAVETPYFDAIARIDGYLKQLHEILRERNEEWVLVVVTDHGHRDEGGHGGDSPQERASFVIAHGINTKHPEWPKDMQPHDLADLILELIY